jgi:hypothetical protein
VKSDLAIILIPFVFFMRKVALMGLMNFLVGLPFPQNKIYSTTECKHSSAFEKILEYAQKVNAALTLAQICD